MKATSPLPLLGGTVDFLRHDVAPSEPTRRRGMNLPAESWKSPLKGTPNLCWQSASADFGRLSRGIHSPVTAFPFLAKEGVRGRFVDRPLRGLLRASGLCPRNG